MILKMLSHSVARLESGERKRKQEKEEVTFLKSVKKVKRDKPNVSNINTDMIESLIVYHYLKEVSEKLAEGLSALQTSKHVFNYLKIVSSQPASMKATLQNPSNKSKREQANKKTGTVPKRFTAKEDEIIKVAIEEVGEDNVNAVVLAKRLNRPFKSVVNRIDSIIRNGGIIKPMKFSSLEDSILLETLVIPRVGSEKLSEIVLQKHHYAALTKRLGKSPIAVRHRWITNLQPWLLQHYSGTLNLRVERMLANYIRETYTDFSSIILPEVAARCEFTGHTASSLQKLYRGSLSPSTKKKFGLQGDMVTPQFIAEYCELVYRESAIGRAKNGASPAKIKRQIEVISLFERKITGLRLDNFI